MAHTGTKPRPLVRVHRAEPVTDGDGVCIHRIVAHRALHTYDPFLLLDELGSDDAADYIGGFPEHPHRGFETVTYMLEGRMRHRDHLGNEGVLEAGSVQWMTAGRGVLHSEMPEQQSGRLHGFQLWVNLPAAEKMQPPAWREYPAADIPVVPLGTHSEARVIAGSLPAGERCIRGPVQGVSTQPDYFDLRLAAGDTLTLPADPARRVLLYVYAGSVQVMGSDGPRSLSAQQLGDLGDGDCVTVGSADGARLLWLAGWPLHEPIANWGPFVMNTRDQIEQAIHDYRNGTLASTTGETP